MRKMLNLGEPKILNTLPRHAAPVSAEECARALDIPLRVVEIAIKTGALSSQGGKIELVDLIAWKKCRAFAGPTGSGAV